MKVNRIPLTHRLASLALGLLLASLVIPQTYAATKTWTNTVSGNWSDATSWDPNGVPADNDDLIFPSLTGDPVVLTTNDLPGSASAAGIVIHSMVISGIGSGGGAYTINGNPIVMGAGAGITNASTNVTFTCNSDLILTETLRVWSSCRSNSIVTALNGRITPYTASPVGLTMFGQFGNPSTDGAGAIALGNSNAFTGPIIVNSNYFVISSIANGGAQIADAVALTSGNNFFTYTGTAWDAAQVGQGIWLPAADTTSLLPLPPGTIITAVNTGTKTVTLSANAVASSTSAAGWIGYPNALGFSTSDSANLVFNGNLRPTLRYNGPTTSTDRNYRRSPSTYVNVADAGADLTLSGSCFTTNNNAWVKRGPGRLTLTGTAAIATQNNRAPLLIDAGAGSVFLNSPGWLTFSNTINPAAASAVKVNPGTLFGGDGSILPGFLEGIANSATLPAGVIAPGQDGQVGTLTVGGLFLRGTNTLLYDIVDTANCDRIVSTNFINTPAGVAPDNIVHIVLNGSPTLANAHYTLMTAGVSIGGSTDNWTVDTAPPSGQIYSIVYDTASTPKKLVLHVSYPAMVATLPTAGAAIFGQPLSGVTLSGGSVTNGNDASPVPGTFAFTSPATVPPLGLSTQSVKFTPTDTVNFPTLTTTVDVTVDPANTTMLVGSAANPAVVGVNVTLTATVSPVAPGAGTPTGTVDFKDGGVYLTTVGLVGGVATFDTPSLTLGSHNITAEYLGDGNYNGSTNSPALTQVIIPFPPTSATNITATVSGGNLTLTWPSSYTGWTLQTQTNSLSVGISNNWSDVSGSASTNQVVIPINPNNPTVFYRMWLFVP